MVDDRTSTQARIIAAARAEFAAFGLAGSRIDRIALAASASKERLYAYYSDKRALFLAVLELNLREFTTSVVLTDHDVAAFAVSLFDLTVTHANHLRMMDWARLELDDLPAPTMTMMAEYRGRQVALIEQAQSDGLVDASWSAEHLMTMIFGLATAWVHEPGSALLMADPPRGEAASVRRSSVIRGIELLISPTARGPLANYSSAMDR